jgi:thiol-disulfide isomerase/thioredoxin
MFDIKNSMRRFSLVLGLILAASSAFGQSGGAAPAGGQGPGLATAPGSGASLESRLAGLGFQVFRKPVALPDLSLPGLDGKKTSLSSLRGKVVFLNFWATWCPPCRAEMPSIEKLWTELKGQDFAVMAVDQGEAAQTVSAFLKKNAYSFPAYLDADGEAGSLFGVQGIPTTFIIGKDGKALARVVGGLEYGSPEAIALFRELAARK